MDKARKAALTALNKVFKDGSYSNLTLNSVFGDYELSDTDKKFASAIFYGVLDRKISLDYVLNKYLKKGIDKTSVLTANALRIALYQIMFMDKVPKSAAVNESVNLVKRSRESYNSSLVNGTLRNILRNGYELPNGNTAEDLSIRFSCPLYIVEELINDYGNDSALSFLKNSLETPPVYLKVNTLKVSAEELAEILKNEGVNVQKYETDYTLKVNGGIDVSKLDSFKKGYFHIEDFACQKSIELLSVKQNEKMLDLCAAPGGKSFTAAEFMEDKGKIISCDIYKSRVELILKGAKRLCLNSVKATQNDATEFSDLGEFDVCLCDVPCSGIGVIRRKPEIKYKPENDYKELSRIQTKIMENADKYLKVGGRLMYSTCTVRKAENENIVKEFLNKHSNYTLKLEHTFFPDIDGSDGFYCALLIKSR